MKNTELQIMDHLDELRKRLIITAVAFILFLALGLFFAKDIYNFFMGNLGYKLMVLGPSDIIWIFFHLATIIAVAGTIPVLAWQIWLFVKPALKSFERKAALSYIPAMFFLFLAGLAFGYFFIFPNIMTFLLKMGDGLMVPSFTAEKYIGFLINMTLPFGIAFEMPLVLMFLTTLGIVNPYKVVKLRKYAYFILVIIASMISPPEIMSHLSVAVPLILLFEISIFLAKIVYKKKQKRQDLLDSVEIG
ncbi:twin-arginine translocase subunit TatC [Neobacillus vireti]|uniref:Sec-independent protein translocase protein TatC n=1 Tax=Neobacillus vireti LMG 21834 TaxID=1131730 RepID=A0AB94IT48_9BACI|nr:twin-arginine translocase subunit TatC [Neobacillus vireti]ETI70143.1 twin-arginine translocation protein TatA [Neobacillus vireti LMG 21834]KLT16484.1 preprotein translocase subunit TatC [Neobacillus vireti]